MPLQPEAAEAGAVRPIIFLDIDGVLNSTRWFVHLVRSKTGKAPIGKVGIDPSALALLHLLVEELNLRVVVSSTWRLLHTKETLEAILELPVHDVTPPPRMSSVRGHDIQSWLIVNGESETPYVIVDDDGDMLPDQAERFVQTKNEDGLLWSDYTAIRKLFGVTSQPRLWTTTSRSQEPTDAPAQP